jgi:hypothetical protein
MFDEYEAYQGVVLRHLVVDAGKPIEIKPFVTHGRISSFILNNRAGVFVKHSSKRLSPWRFTFHIDQVADLLDLEAAYPQSFMAFVCGSDGLVALDMMTLHQLVSFESTDQAWLRMDRSPRSLYSVAGNRGEADTKFARGVSRIVEALNG